MDDSTSLSVVCLCNENMYLYQASNALSSYFKVPRGSDHQISVPRNPGGGIGHQNNRPDHSDATRIKDFIYFIL